MLRRGVDAAGAAVPGYDPTDRSRAIKTHDADDGFLEVDRPYAVAPVAGEEVEVCLLEPEQELRVAVTEGLKRCWFRDRVTVTTVAAAAERDLTAARSWLTKPSQLLGVEFLADGDTVTLPDPLAWWKHFESGGHLRLAGAPDPYPDTLYVTALRPHWSWVNGATSVTGPTADADVLDVDTWYAVTAAHWYAWEHFADRLAPVAQTGLKLGRDQVGQRWAEWVARVPRPPDRIQLSYPYGAWS